MWRTSPVRGFSASTRTPTSIDVRHAALTCALNVSELAGVDRLVERHAVEAGGHDAPPEWRNAASPAASSL